MRKRSKPSVARSARNCECSPFCKFPLALARCPLAATLELDLLTPGLEVFAEPGLAGDPTDALAEPVDDVTPLVIGEPAPDCVDVTCEPELAELPEPAVEPNEFVVDEVDGTLFLVAELVLPDDRIRVASIMMTGGPLPVRARPTPKLRPNSPPPLPPRP